jgi:holo-[acyl-carrier protein] synthase
MPNSFKCGVDFVDISRVKCLVNKTTSVDLDGIFSQEELDYAGKSKSRYGRLAARFAAKEACLKLFPRETAIASIDLSDFSVKNDSYGAPHISLSQRASILLDLYGFQKISISLSHTKDHAMAMAIATRKDFKVSILRRLIDWLLPIRRKLFRAILRRDLPKL